MKRIQKCKKLNRNNNSFNHLSRKASHHNSVSSDILVSQLWLQENEPTPVEIIELNPPQEFELSPDESQDDKLEHAWSYVNSDRLQQIEDNYKINKKARERRRLSNENHLFSTNAATNTTNHVLDNFYGDIASTHIDNSKLINHQVNCFTIINKHLINSESTSSDGEIADVEIITSNDIIMEPKNWDTRNNSYGEDIITYEPDLDKETRTIWIYSFKNKHLLTEDDYNKFINVNAKETSSCSTSCSTIESDEELTKDKSTNVCRLGSPIPPAYIPRLNLSLAPTLSTVTEISEPTKPSPNGSNKSPKIKFQKPKNSWFLNETEKIDSGKLSKHEKSTNIVNWMALSPREKRRRSKEQEDKWEGSILKLETLHAQSFIESNEQQSNGLGPDNSLRLQVDVDVHVSVSEKSPKHYADANIKRNADETNPFGKIKYADADIKECVQDRGDHDMKFVQTQQMLCITKPEKPLPDITQSVEKIDSTVWEREAKEERETGSFNYVTNKMEIIVDPANNSADQLWMKNNTPLLKPSQWNEYLPISESPCSLHLSLGSIIEERQPWFKRFLSYINCCK